MTDHRSGWLERALPFLVVLAFAVYAFEHVRAVATRGENIALVEAGLLLTTFALLHAIHMLGWRRALAFFGICAVLSWAAEQHSITSGNVGEYYYTEVLGPKLLDVPYVIPLTWFLMMYPSHVMTNLIVERVPALRRGTIPLAMWLAFLTAAVMTAWDLALDPYMVGVVGAWVWVDGGPYFGVPFANYFGWIHVVFLIDLIYRLVARRLPLEPIGRVGATVALLPVGVYAMNTLSSMIVGSPPETRLIAAFAMGIPVWMALTRIVQGIEARGRQGEIELAPHQAADGETSRPGRSEPGVA
ncbi:MAG TPA: carotenoid biosynthesis protein [Thermoanaerobaculia bacterium]|nr:carotenoid biosynthesis protein [Thermoanaerobaculia bacterium]